MIFSYWIWIGTIQLVLLTVKDFKNNMIVDDRHNWFMYGISFSLYSHMSRAWWYVFFLIALTVVLRWILLKFTKALGEADLNSITWIFYGFGILNPIWLFCFFGIFAVYTGIYYIVKKYIATDTGQDPRSPTPFYIVILASFFTTAIAFGLY